MKIAEENIDRDCIESDIYESLLELDNKQLLELGCGSAEITRNIACTGTNRNITALEIDEIAYAKNLLITDLPNVSFVLSGAQQIPLPDNVVDVVFMFKSLHHVPVDLMGVSMCEINRVLKPGGRVYLSEPVFAGDFNEILRLFHDEQQVREAAFSAIQKSIDDGLFELVEEIFFNAPMRFKDFLEFEQNTIKATHSHHSLEPDLYQQVKQRFESHVGDDGANFLMPMRVDLLSRLP